MKKNIYLMLMLLLVSVTGCRQHTGATDADTADLPPEAFMRISGTDLITPKGQKGRTLATG